MKVLQIHFTPKAGDLKGNMEVSTLVPSNYFPSEA